MPTSEAKWKGCRNEVHIFEHGTHQTNNVEEISVYRLERQTSTVIRTKNGGGLRKSHKFATS